MDLQPESLSPDTIAIADTNSQPNGSSSDTVSTSTPVVCQQDSGFLRLPLEVRLMIYNHALDFRLDETANPLMSLPCLSRQIRAEVQALIVDSRARLLVTMTSKGLRVSPSYVFGTSRNPRALDTKLVLPLTWLLFSHEIPSTFGFRRALLAFVRAIEVHEYVHADIDMRMGTVHILGDNEWTGDDVNSTFNFGPPEDGFGSSLQALQEPLRVAMQSMVKEKGSDIFTASDILCMLEQMSVDWSELLDTP